MPFGRQPSKIGLASSDREARRQEAAIRVPVRDRARGHLAIDDVPVCVEGQTAKPLHGLRHVHILSQSEHLGHLRQHYMTLLGRARRREPPIN